MREYTLNDIGFTPGPIEPLPIGEGVDNATKGELQAAYKRNREESEKLLREFEKRAGGVVMDR